MRHATEEGGGNQTKGGWRRNLLKQHGHAAGTRLVYRLLEQDRYCLLSRSSSLARAISATLVEG
jgi:hypothetical protein